jgi:hypothetical protein
MKKILLAVGIGAIVALAAIVAMLKMANRVGDSVQSDFFAIVATNDPEVFLDAADPRMRDEVDVPLLRQWMETMNEKLGSYEGLEPTDFHSSTRFEKGNRIVETTGTIRFEHGTAKSELAFVNGKLEKFHVTSAQLGEDWLSAPHDTTIYRAKAETFYADVGNRDFEAAYGYLSESLRRKLLVDEFRTMVDQIGDGLGDFLRVDFVTEEFISSKDEGQRLLLRYKLVGTSGSFDAEAVFVFHGLKTHFSEFNVAAVNNLGEQ